MNAKFRMPKLWGELKFTGTFKELVLTIVGTTISIILTFGTSAWLEQRSAEQSRRLMAMTVINDIDQSLNVIRNRSFLEERGKDVTNYLMNNINRLESIPDDTLFMFFNYITTNSFNTNEEFKMANENIFNSSQDSWRTLNDRKFLNNVQEFYNARKMLEKQTREWVYFQKPVTKEEEYQIIMDNGEMANRETFLPVVRRLLQSPRVQNYVENSNNRMNLYRILLSLVNLNEENKFLMNITDEDLKNFTKKTYMMVRRAKENELVGSWDAVLNDGQREISYEYRKDHTFTTYQTFKWTHALFQGQMLQRITISGTWAVEGDSLVKKFDKSSYKVEADDKGINYSPEHAEAIKAIKAEITGDGMKADFVKQLEKSNYRHAAATNLDKSGTRLELTDGGSVPVHYQKK